MLPHMGLTAMVVFTVGSIVQSMRQALCQCRLGTTIGPLEARRFYIEPKLRPGWLHMEKVEPKEFHIGSILAPFWLHVCIGSINRLHHDQQCKMAI